MEEALQLRIGHEPYSSVLCLGCERPGRVLQRDMLVHAEMLRMPMQQSAHEEHLCSWA